MHQAWGAALRNIRPDAIKTAIGKLYISDDPWPPTPGQFRALCLPTAQDLGLPDRETAWRQAVGNAKLSHPVVWHVREKVGSWNLKNLPQAATRTKFDQAWADILARAAIGESFDWPDGLDPARGIEDTRRMAGRRGSTTAGEAAIRAVRAVVGANPTDAAGEPLPAPGAQDGA